MTPAGTVVFLFTDIEGSTARWEAYPQAMDVAIRRHDALLRTIMSESNGHVFKTVGDAFYVAFSLARDAVAAAYRAQCAIGAHDWSDVDGLRVRMAIHIGAVEARDGDYFGRPLNRVARIVSIGHGGQILLSAAAADPALAALDEAFSLRDLGEHRLKDLGHPERIFQLLAPRLTSEFPPLRSLGGKPNNLPIALTSFIGRSAEIGTLRRRFADARLLTLLGFGGVGKTRLALAIAAESVDRFPGGVWFIDLSPIANLEIVAADIARTIGVTVRRDEPATQALVEALRERATLLVIDGCEHVLPAVAEVVAALLRACPDVRIIATTRQALDVPGETIHHVETFDVPPTSVKTAHEAAAYAAVQLFVERCASAAPGFVLDDGNAAVIVDICRRLDGIALAIELAAPKVRVLTPRQLSERLSERFKLLSANARGVVPRQLTLRALIDWSFDSLDADERAVFRRLSVFAGSFTLEAAAAVCVDGVVDTWRAFDLCSALVAKSLLIANAGGTEARFRFLDSIREYARERLAEAAETETVYARATAFYVARLRELAPSTEPLDEETWRAAVSPEIDNIRGCADFALARGHDPQVGRELLVAFDWPQSVTTPREAIGWFDLADGYDAPFASPRDEARFLRHYCRLAWIVGRAIPSREAMAQRAVAIARAADDGVARALALKALAGAYTDGGRYDEADAVFEEALAIADLPARTRTGVLADRAINDLERGDLALARERFGIVATMEKRGSVGHGVALLNLAELEFATRDFAAARASGREAKDVLERLGAAPLALLACNRAAYEMAVDAFDDARTVLCEALEHLADSGQVWTVTALEHHAVFCGLLGDVDTAAALLGYTDARIKEAGTTRKQTERYGYERIVTLLTRALGADALRRRLDLGARLTREEALAIAAEIHTPNERIERRAVALGE